MLLEHRANVNEPGERSQSALLLAASHGHTELVRLLLECSAHVDARSDSRTTPLLAAADEGHAQVVALLIAARADVLATNDDEDHALTIASRRGYTALVKLLVDGQHIPVDKRGYNSATALMIACEHARRDVVEYLLEKRADLFARNSTKNTPVHAACLGGSVEILQILLAAGASIDVVRRLICARARSRDAHDRDDDTSSIG